MDAIILILAMLAIIVPFALAQLWYWVALWVVIAAVLAIFELVSYLKTGRTISQKFWKWRKTAPRWKRNLILGGMIAFWLYLILHLFLEV